ncbi:MAG: OmpA family protein [Treponema sp.]|nr:OmpA family protein [Treponema sp.]
MRRQKFILKGLMALAFMPLASAQIYYTDAEIEREAELASMASANVSVEKAVMTSSSSIDWTKNTFTSNVALDVVKAGIPMPSGKASSLNHIQMELPVLVKDPLLSIYVDDTHTLSDLVLEGSFTLEELTRIIDGSRQTPAVFASGTSNLLTEHTIQLQNIGASLVKHNIPYTLRQPIETVSTKEYTGIIIDARGSLPIQGEFISSETYPCLFPKIWNERMDLLYERNMVDPGVAKSKGIVHYSSSIFIKDYEDRVGRTPLWITAKKVYGINRCDPVISWEDYLRITSIKSNLELLRQGKIVILLDDKNLKHAVSAPRKDKNYYIAYHNLKRYIDENKIPDTSITEIPPGILITQHLRFYPDSPELLPEELERVTQVAQSLRNYVSDGGYSIMVAGHTADVNKPGGQLTLSIQRAQTIIDILVSRGLDRSLFTYRGYGGTMPVADNSTPEGRAQNRRVEITVMPTASYVQRQ